MRGLEFELDQLLNPAAAFSHPRDVLNDPDLSRQEKRAILSSWASDACAVESAPQLRHPPGAPAPVPFDDIVDALRSLDDPNPPRPGGAPQIVAQRPDVPVRTAGGAGVIVPELDGDQAVKRKQIQHHGLLAIEDVR